MSMSFFKDNKKHFYKLYFQYGWWLLLILIAAVCTQSYLQQHIMPQDIVQANDFNKLQEHMMSVNPLYLLGFLGSFGLSIVAMFGLYIFTPLYFLLYAHYQRTFTLRDLYTTFGSRFGRIVIYFLFAVLLMTIIMVPVFFLLSILMSSMLGAFLIPLLIGGIILAFSVAFYDYMVMNTTVWESFQYGFRVVVKYIGRYTINFVFLLYFIFLVVILIQSGILSLLENVLNATPEPTLSIIFMSISALEYILFMLLMTFLQMYVNIGYSVIETIDIIRSNHQKDAE